MTSAKPHQVPPLTPAKNPFVLPTPALSDAIATEWQVHGKYIPRNMPLTTLAYTAIDRIAGQEENIVEAMLCYLDTDTLCYRSEGALSERQKAEWDPILGWLKQTFGVGWEVTTSIHAVQQPTVLHDALQKYLQGFDAMHLAVGSMLASLYSSLALAIAVLEGYVEAEEALRLSRLEEDYQAEQWGRDEEAEKSAARLKEETTSVKRFLRLLEAV